MKLLYECGIPAAGFFIWIVLTFVIVPTFIRYLRKSGDRTQRLPEIPFPTRTVYMKNGNSTKHLSSPSTSDKPVTREAGHQK